jgi:3-hydroxybutyryl-CoA dehydrogenase
VGSGAIACGLAATAAQHGVVQVLARSEPSAERARASIARMLARRAGGGELAHPEVLTDVGGIAEATFIVEAVVEDFEIKAGLLAELGERAAENVVLATTTSSLSIERLAQASGRRDRFVGLHVFNPVDRMKLVELVHPRAASERTRSRAVALCEEFEKTAIEVPDVPGFVVNRLLFPYLFSAVRLLEQTGMDAGDLDRCMKLGAGHPMGPLALLDLVGIDVAQAIGNELGEQVPAMVDELVSEGALGRKSRRGFHDY